MLNRNKQMMSKTEQRVYFYIDKTERRILPIEVLYDARICSRETLRNILHRLVKKEWLTRIKKGWYAVNDLENISLADTFSLATIIFNGYIAFSSALYLYGAMDENPYTIFVATDTLSALKHVGSMEIKAVALHSLFTGTADLPSSAGYSYAVSTRAKTLYDCFHIPRYAGGYSNIAAAVPRLMQRKEDWTMFKYYIGRFGTVSLKRRIGYVLWLLEKNGVIQVPKELTMHLNVGKAIYKFGNGKHGKYIREWRLISYMNEEQILGKLLWT